MRYAQINSKYVCGIDHHAREMYACVMNKQGEILFHRNMRTDFVQFKQKLPDFAVGSESTYMYYWLADACRKEKYSVLSRACLSYVPKASLREKAFMAARPKPIVLTAAKSPI